MEVATLILFDCCSFFEPILLPLFNLFYLKKILAPYLSVLRKFTGKYPRSSGNSAKIHVELIHGVSLKKEVYTHCLVFYWFKFLYISSVRGQSDYPRPSDNTFQNIYVLSTSL